MPGLSRQRSTSARLGFDFKSNYCELEDTVKGTKQEKCPLVNVGPSHLLATMRTDSETTIRTIEVTDLTVNDVIVLIMGPPGSGKTTFIKTAAGVKGPRRLKPRKTTDISAFRVSASELPNSNIVLVDTPAFNVADKPDIEVLKMISDWLNQTYMRGIQLSGLIYFHQIRQATMDGPSLMNWRAVEKICGEGFNKVVLTTTMWNNVDSEVGNNRERELEIFWRTNLARGSSMKRFLRNRPSAADVLSPIIGNVTKVPLQLQREITDFHMPLKQTTVVRALYLQLEALLRDCQEYLIIIQEDLKSPSINTRDLRRLEGAYKGVSLLIERVTEGLADLKITPAERLQRFILIRVLGPALGLVGLRKRYSQESDGGITLAREADSDLVMTKNSAGEWVIFNSRDFRRGILLKTGEVVELD